MTTADDAQTLQAVTEAIAAAGDAGAPSVLRHLVAAAFARRVGLALRGGGALQLAAWLERTAETYANDAEIARFLPTACTAVAACLQRRGAEESFVADLATMYRAVHARVAERQVATTRHHTDGIDELIAELLVTLDDADPLTAEHSRAVSLWCRRIARRMALGDEAATYVARGGLLHDIGKTKTPPSILTAPRKLTAEEYAIMQDHASLGHAIVAEIPALRPYLPLVLHHHERLDGKGYPDRLAAAQIPLAVRIVTVADCFNAMIGRRPYRLPMSPAAALEQLSANVDTQFDRAVVEAMIDVVTRPD